MFSALVGCEMSRLAFGVGDAHDMGHVDYVSGFAPVEKFDVVLMHTLISHTG